MKRSISNLAWGNEDVSELAPRLQKTGVEGVEIAPTVIWPDAPNVRAKDVSEHKQKWNDYGITVSGVQSLLYGHPNLQIFDRTTWPALLEHLKAMVELSSSLGAGVVVFGSPRNRIKGDLDLVTAHEVFLEFLHKLIPVLENNEVMLTLEPNAPEYGADYLNLYSDVVFLSDLVGSSWIQPQIDTGCLVMVGEDPVASVSYRSPAHVHVSTPHLGRPPGDLDHVALNSSLNEDNYEGWVVLEMLQVNTDPIETAIESASWLANTYTGHTK
jgi:sugar phosphate isomerase/epimerase